MEQMFTIQQLSAVHHLINTERPPYTDFALLRPYGMRTAKQVKLAVNTIDSAGKLQKEEIYGPGNIQSWNASYNVLKVILISLNAVTRAIVQNYQDFINLMAQEYGPLCWPLLYQSDVRCRSERTVRLRALAISEHNKAVTAGTPTQSPMDETRPWNIV